MSYIKWITQCYNIIVLYAFSKLMSEYSGYTRFAHSTNDDTYSSPKRSKASTKYDDT